MSRLILNIETSEKNCSVALGQEGRLLAEKVVESEQFSHAEQLHLLIKALMVESNKSFTELDAVAVSEGPGSYTGLRIGVSAAKGLAYACGVPLVAVPTLFSLFQGLGLKKGYDYYVPMIDARRMEVYSCVLDTKGQVVRGVEAEVLDLSSYSELVGEVAVFGSGANKAAELLVGKVLLLNDHMNYARNMIEISDRYFLEGKTEDVAYFEPYYLKDFRVGTPKKIWN